MANKTILAYGSLRPGCFNHAFIKCLSVSPDMKLNGYQLMEERGRPYPFAVEKRGGTIMVNAITVSQDTYDLIYDIEINAGYKAVNIHGSTLFVYTMDVTSMTPCKSNDWLCNPLKR